MGMIIGLVVLALIALVVVWAIGRYNQMIGTAEMVDNAMAQIAAQVESRWDALSNLISATKSYQSHEADTLKQIVHERSGVSRQSSVSQIEEDQAQFERAMRAIDVVVEQYPDLKASGVYQQTMSNVDKYENNVRQSRMVFNDMVTKFNRLIKVFPNSIIANLTGFQPKDYFKSSPDKAEMPQW
ncbi:LemA family protein [Aerococcus sanguinicola]|uniref:LemA family protein n=1 Tax=unclassified Aerococcus TaxID=2618060 RepID=UPI000ADA3688|nr:MULTISPECIES: LemA family protein [unclassified Aerococcus]MDK6232806.1 LemA family protein [Aerococcus sp. UMB10185]MDK6854903.1 LemA family protein [Aerococcus sp. UMB7533]MDK8501830.1 LemA family protein [Aerococcus sp. UMB1112A]